MDEPRTSIPEGREPKMPHRLGRADNDMETVIEKAFANMDDGMKDMENEENTAEFEINNLINEVVNEVNLGQFGANSVSNMLRKFENIKQRFFIWKIKSQHLRWGGYQFK